tara:strand:- start:302 stop:502 length:201 start_codon:yes stop_codon:yes gene_type:complete
MTILWYDKVLGGSMSKPLIRVGTETIIGTVVDIEHDGVTVQNNQGVKEKFSFREFELKAKVKELMK